MARKSKTQEPTVTTEVEATVAPMFSQLVAAPATEQPAPVAKIHATTLGEVTYRTANHVATLKGGAACPVAFAGTTYKLGQKAYSPKAGTFTVMQWAAYNNAIAAHGGQATGLQIWQAGIELGMQGHQLASLPGFGPYRAKPGNLAIVA